MSNHPFKIELQEIHWLESYGEETQLDLCAHGKVRVIIGNEVVAENNQDRDDWWSLTAMALHLLRTLDQNHSKENLVGDCLIPSEGHHLDHQENTPYVHIETSYPMKKGVNWWVYHHNNNVKLVSEKFIETTIPFEEYKAQVLNFFDQVKDFYSTSKPKVLPKIKYDKEGYLKLWHEWETRRSKWKETR